MNQVVKNWLKRVEESKTISIKEDDFTIKFAKRCELCGTKITPHYLEEWTDHCEECAEWGLDFCEEDDYEEECRNRNKILAKHALREQGWPNDFITPKIIHIKQLLLETKRKIKKHAHTN